MGSGLLSGVETARGDSLRASKCVLESKGETFPFYYCGHSSSRRAFHQTGGLLSPPRLAFLLAKWAPSSPATANRQPLGACLCRPTGRPFCCTDKIDYRPLRCAAELHFSALSCIELHFSALSCTELHFSALCTSQTRSFRLPQQQQQASPRSEDSRAPPSRTGFAAVFFAPAASIWPPNGQSAPLANFPASFPSFELAISQALQLSSSPTSQRHRPAAAGRIISPALNSARLGLATRHQRRAQITHSASRMGQPLSAKLITVSPVPLLASLHWPAPNGALLMRLEGGKSWAPKWQATTRVRERRASL